MMVLYIGARLVLLVGLNGLALGLSGLSLGLGGPVNKTA